MNAKLKLPQRLKVFIFLIGLTMLFNINSAIADTHLSVQVSDPLAFRNYFWIDRTFGGLLSDFIELADGTYKIEVFGPPGTPQYPNSNMFYALTIGVKVLKAIPEVQSVSFDSYCADEGIKVHVKEWPTPLIIKDKQLSNSYRLEIKIPILADRETPCEPLPRPSIAPWTNIGNLKLITTSTPAGAEVWIDGELIGKTNSTINVPYRKEEINVVIRMPSYVNCKWTLKGPFKEDARLNCVSKTP